MGRKPITMKAKILKFTKGDKAKLRKDVLVRHSKSIPAHAGYATEGFRWRETLAKLKGKVGTIERTFPSGHVNLEFRDGTIIGIDDSELVKVSKSRGR